MLNRNHSYFSILFDSVTFIQSLYRAEEGVPSPPPPFFYFNYFFCAHSPSACAGWREGIALDRVQHTYLPRALPVGGILPTRLEPAEAPQQTLLKAAFTMAKPAEPATAKNQRKDGFKSP